MRQGIDSLAGVEANGQVGAYCNTPLLKLTPMSDSKTQYFQEYSWVI